MAGGAFGEVAGTDFLEERESVFAGEFEAAHVGDVEDGGVGAGVFVLRDDAAVEEGHFPAGEVDHFRAGCDVEIVEWGTLEFRAQQPLWPFERGQIERGMTILGCVVRFHK